MNKTTRLLIAIILTASLITSSCNVSITINPTAASNPPTAPNTAPVPKSTLRPNPTSTQTILINEIPTSTNEPIHEIYAGFTSNSNIPFLALHKSGEKLGVTEEGGVVWSSPTGESIVIFLDGNGSPKSAIIGQYVIHYSNYTNSTVDITIIFPNGNREVLRAKYSYDLSKRITAHLASPYHQVNYLIPNSIQLQQQDIWEKIDDALFDLDVATCTFDVLKAGAANPALAELLKIVDDSCTGAFIDLKIKEGKAQNMDVTNLEGIKVLHDTFGCEVLGQVKDCIGVIVTAMQTLRVKAVYAEDHVPPALVPTVCVGKYHDNCK